MTAIKWKKLGRVYQPSLKGRHPKLLSHAANPLPIHLEGDTYRVFYSGRDSNNRSSVGAVDIDVVTRAVIKDHYTPFFEHGGEGSFYADGVSIGNCYEASGERHMLFMGWQTPKNGHWRGDIGRLVVMPDLTLKLGAEEPFMAVDEVDPVSLSYPWVAGGKDGSFSMWYGSTVSWDAGNNEMLHCINYAESTDGLRWERKGLAIPYELGVAQAFSRPTVYKDTINEHMWFSYRCGTGKKYRIGYAVRKEGEPWELRLEDAGIAVSPEGWDSEMIEYPFVFEHKGRLYMLYNGNEHGRSGFGLAIQE